MACKAQLDALRMMSAISSGVTLSQNRNQIGSTFGAPTTSSVLGAALGQQLGRVIMQMY